MFTSKAMRTAVALALGVGVLAYGAATETPEPAAAACTINTTLRAGSSGTQVACLEQTLKAKGLQSTYIDSYFGTITRTTIINYQRSKGFVADGVVGQRTAQSLGIWATSAPVAAAPTYSCIQFSLSTPNSWRTSAGIPALRDGFYSGACSWAKSMAKSGVQSHDPGLPSTTGEVIYRWYGKCDAATAFTAWKNSAPHRAVILLHYSGFTTYGAFACVEAGGRAYAVGRIGF